MSIKSTTKNIVKNYARQVGFDLVGIASVEEFAEDQAITLDRLRAGLMDGLPWYNESRVLRGTRPEELLPGAKSIICLGLNYYQLDNTDIETSQPVGKVARYARGQDYHKVMKKRMKEYVVGLSDRLGSPITARWYVDDGPMLDRACARRAGLGWFGKNTNILTQSHGSWVFLGQVLCDLDIVPDLPLLKTCGNCVRCIDACPTGAIVAPYVIDNTKCISYLTIENRGPIPRVLRPQMQDWVFGCDICQDVCPVNSKSRPSSEPAFQRKDLGLLELTELLELSDEQFLAKFKGSPILRAKRTGLQRNACVALGNRQNPDAIPSLAIALATSDSLVRGHAAWALGCIGGRAAINALEQAYVKELEPEVLSEISAALKTLK